MPLAPIDIAYALTNKIFDLCILPTEKCNFRCKYCYEDFAIGKMAPSTVGAIKELLRKRVRNDLELLKLSWFGGEPLLAKDVVLEISKYASDLASENNCVFAGSMTTNAWLLDADISRELCLLGVSHYQITVDGPREFHNTVRTFGTTRPTYDRILGNIRELLKINSNVNITLRIHVRPNTYSSMSCWIKDELEDLIDDARVNFFFMPIRRLEGTNPVYADAFNNEEEEKMILDHLRKIVHVQKKTSKPFTRLQTGCYASRPNAMIIRADGRISKCTVALNDPCNIVGTLKENGEIDFQNGLLRKWFIGLETDDLNCFNCPLPYVKARAQQKQELDLVGG